MVARHLRALRAECAQRALRASRRQCGRDAIPTSAYFDVDATALGAARAHAPALPDDGVWRRRRRAQLLQYSRATKAELLSCALKLVRKVRHLKRCQLYPRAFMRPLRSVSTASVTLSVSSSTSSPRRKGFASAATLLPFHASNILHERKHTQACRQAPVHCRPKSDTSAKPSPRSRLVSGAGRPGQGKGEKWRPSLGPSDYWGTSPAHPQMCQFAY